MKIHKILNNNVAVVLDEHGDEKIVMGKGICFKKTAGDQIAEGMIDKTFLLSGMEANSKFQVLVQDIPMEHIAVGEEIIAEAKTNKDSVGGIVECAVAGLPVGLGEPIFDGLESRLSTALFAIPAVKGVEFGEGFRSATLYGSENNDAFFYKLKNKGIC